MKHKKLASFLSKKLFILGNKFFKEISLIINTFGKYEEDSSQKKSADIFISAEVDSDEGYVQAQNIFRIKIYRNVQTRQPRLYEPEITGAETIIETVGDDRNYESVIDGKTYNVIERVYALFPQESGLIEISPVRFEARILKNGSITGKKIYQSDSINIDVLPIPSPPSGYQAADWLPASKDKIKKPWTEEEIKASVQSYFAMLEKQKKNQFFVKKNYYMELEKRFNRSWKSFEFRMQNISHVLDTMGEEWLEGLKPLSHVGNRIQVIIEKYLKELIAHKTDNAVLTDDNNSWLMLLKKANRVHAGNAGYEDKAQVYYSWDNTVQNYQMPAAGDSILIWNGKTSLGISKIENIILDNDKKPRYRCPFCKTTNIRERIDLNPSYRCASCFKQFSTPIKEMINVRTYRSWHNKEWTDLRGKIDAVTLRSICEMPKSQHSIRKIDDNKLRLLLEKLSPTDQVTVFSKKRNNLRENMHRKMDVNDLKHNFIADKEINKLFDLSVRTKNCLREANIRTIGELIIKKPQELMMLPNMGKKSILEIEKHLSSIDLKLGISKSEIESNDPRKTLELKNNAKVILEELLQYKNVNKVDLTDPRFEDINNFRLTMDLIEDGNSLVKVLEYLHNEMIDSESINITKLFNALKQTLHIIKSIDKMSLHEQLIDPLNAYYKKKSTRDLKRESAMSLRLGLTGKDPITLEATAKKFPKLVTRERVRQLESKLLKWFGKRNFYIPKLDNLLDSLQSKNIVTTDDCRLLSKEYGSEGCSPRSLKAICELYGKNFNFNIVRRGGSPQFLINFDPKFFELLITHGKKFSSGTGFVNTPDLKNFLESKHDSGLSHDVINYILLNSGEFKEIEENWFVALNIARNRFENICKLMFRCVNPINVSFIREGYRRVRAYRRNLQKDWSWKIPPSSLILKYFKQIEGFTVNEDGDIKSPLSYYHGMEIGKNDNFLIKSIQATKNRLILSEDLYDLASKNKIQHESLGLYLSYRPFIKKYGYCVWGFRGDSPDYRDIEDISPLGKITREGGFRKHFIEYDEISNCLTLVQKIKRPHNHNIQLSQTWRKYIDGKEFVLKDENGSEYGKLTRAPSNQNILLGTPRILTRIGAEEEDTIKVIFDLVDNTALVTIVDEEELLRNQSNDNDENEKNEDYYNIDEDPMFSELFD